MATSGRYAKGAEKHAEILAATEKLLDLEGEAGTSMRTVAAEANISLTGLVHYFPNRDLLMTAVQRAADEKFLELLAAAGPDSDPGELLIEVMTDKARRPGAGTVYLSLAAAAAVDPAHPAADYLRDRYQRLRDGIAGFVRSRRAAGDIPATVDPVFAAVALIAAADGIQIQWMYDRSIDMGGHVRTVWHRLLAAPPA
jgi:AcrR family transcriptional regulator